MKSVGTDRSPSAKRHADASRRTRAGQLSENGGNAARTVELLGECRITVAPGAGVDSRIEAIADCQRARAARDQLLAGGVDDAAIARRLGKGRLLRVHSGVYALPQTSDVPLADETAALLACGSRAMLSHHSAMTLWGLRPGTARPIHVTIPVGRSGPAPEGVIVHRSRILTAKDVRTHRALPITSPARSILDVAATLPDRDIEQLLNEGLFALRLLTRADIAELLVRAGGHPGRARLTRVANAHIHDTRTDSPPEERLLALIRAGGLPEPRTQVPMLGYRLDFFWPELDLAVEVDGYGTHGSRARFEADRVRDARLLTEKGIVVIRLTAAAIHERPSETIALLARAIGRQEARYDPRRSRSW